MLFLPAFILLVCDFYSAAIEVLRPQFNYESKRCVDVCLCSEIMGSAFPFLLYFLEVASSVLLIRLQWMLCYSCIAWSFFFHISDQSCLLQHFRAMQFLGNYFNVQIGYISRYVWNSETCVHFPLPYLSVQLQTIQLSLWRVFRCISSPVNTDELMSHYKR